MRKTTKLKKKFAKNLDVKKIKTQEHGEYYFVPLTILPEMDILCRTISPKRGEKSIYPGDAFVLYFKSLFGPAFLNVNVHDISYSNLVISKKYEKKIDKMVIDWVRAQPKYTGLTREYIRTKMLPWEHLHWYPIGSDSVPKTVKIKENVAYLRLRKTGLGS